MTASGLPWVEPPPDRPAAAPKPPLPEWARPVIYIRVDPIRGRPRTVWVATLSQCWDGREVNAFTGVPHLQRAEAVGDMMDRARALAAVYDPPLQIVDQTEQPYLKRRRRR